MRMKYTTHHKTVSVSVFGKWLAELTYFFGAIRKVEYKENKEEGTRTVYVYVGGEAGEGSEG